MLFRKLWLDLWKPMHFGILDWIIIVYCMLWWQNLATYIRLITLQVLTADKSICPMSQYIDYHVHHAPVQLYFCEHGQNKTFCLKQWDLNLVGTSPYLCLLQLRNLGRQILTGLLVTLAYFEHNRYLKTCCKITVPYYKSLLIKIILWMIL